MLKIAGVGNAVEEAKVRYAGRLVPSNHITAGQCARKVQPAKLFAIAHAGSFPPPLIHIPLALHSG